LDPRSISRPAPELLYYYALVAAMGVVAFPVVFIPLYCRYITLRYRFDEDGISMSWGLLFRKEVYLTYRRIQDIHVTRNLFHRWIGLASVAIQTASGTAGAEMTVEGIREPEALRDFLYARMRGVGEGEDEEPSPQAPSSTPRTSAPGPSPTDEALTLLREIRDELRRLGAGGRHG
jgi:putative membrane protein